MTEQVSGWKMKLLVTGGAGFVGTHVAEYFSKKGYEVTVLDNLKREEIPKKDIWEVK